MGKQKQAIEGASRGNVFYVDPSVPVVIGLDTEHKAGEHPLFDERVNRPIDEALVKNIGRYGNRVAVVVRKNGAALEVVDGRSRVRACREAAKRAMEAGEAPPRLKVEVMREDEQTQQGVMISLNEQRRADDVITKAKKAARLIACGHCPDEVATMFGVTPQCVHQWLSLTELSATVQRAVANGQVSASAALKLADLPRDEQARKLGEALAEAPTGRRPNAAKLERKVKGAKGFRLTAKVAKAWLREQHLMQALSRDAWAVLAMVAGSNDLAMAHSELAAKIKEHG